MKRSIKDELELIRKKHGGILRPRDIVEFARNKNTALHSRFTWDNSKAALEYRLWQAREIIAVHVRVLEKNSNPVRAYVSLLKDRKLEGGGYRDIGSVLRNPRLRAALLSEAISESERFRDKYRALKEMAEVIGAMDKLIERRMNSFAVKLAS